MNKKYPNGYRWVDRGIVADPYCTDCKGPSSSVRELERKGHYIYVCSDCATVRLSADPICVPTE